MRPSPEERAAHDRFWQNQLEDLRARNRRSSPWWAYVLWAFVTGTLAYLAWVAYTVATFRA